MNDLYAQLREHPEALLDVLYGNISREIPIPLLVSLLEDHVHGNIKLDDGDFIRIIELLSYTRSFKMMFFFATLLDQKSNINITQRMVINMKLMNMLKRNASIVKQIYYNESHRFHSEIHYIVYMICLINSAEDMTIKRSQIDYLLFLFKIDQNLLLDYIFRLREIDTVPSPANRIDNLSILVFLPESNIDFDESTKFHGQKLGRILIKALIDLKSSGIGLPTVVSRVLDTSLLKVGYIIDRDVELREYLELSDVHEVLQFES